MRPATGKVLAACLVLSCAVVAVACGRSGSGSGAARGAGSAATTGRAEPVDVYSSLPMHGPAAAQAHALENGIRLALAQAGDRAGPFTVKYTALDDSGGPDGWDARQTAGNARMVAADPRAVLYIGEFDDGASEVSMPILNEAGIPQLSPANTNVGLTAAAPGSGAAGSPFAPTGTRTFLRIVPTDSIQGAADLEAMQQAGCARAAVVDDGESYGAGMAKLLEAQRHYYDVDVTSDVSFDPVASTSTPFAARITAHRPECVFLAGIASKSTVQMTKDIHAALPAARIFAPGAMCTSAWTNPSDGGVPAALDPLIECTAVTSSLTAYPGGKPFLAAYRARFGVSDPSPYAILGYEAMSLGLSTIAGLGPDGDRKSAVLARLFSTTDRHSVLGTYGFDRNGDTTLRSYGLYKVGRSGDPVFVRTLTPPRGS
jgi:branched-chain amino acid transport system substrate-binding protein